MRQGKLPEDDMILRTIESKNGNRLGVMCSVELGGEVQVGDAVQLIA